MNDAFPLRDTVVHVGDGPFTTWRNDELWADRDRPELGGGHVLSVFGYTQTWTRQERHPTGDELAYLMSGSVDVLLDRGRGERATASPRERRASSRRARGTGWQCTSRARSCS